MARSARFVILGYPHHITHRGNRGETIFFDERDYLHYRQWLHESADEYGLKVWAYCLMTNHIHLVAVPEKEDSLALAIGQSHARYTRWINQKQQWSGHLWANRFFSMPMDESHLWAAIRYVELNPVRAGLAIRAEDYRWSSARSHVADSPDDILAQDLPEGGPQAGQAWCEWLAAGLDDNMVRAIRSYTSRGKPFGSRDFVNWVVNRDQVT